VLIQRCIDQMVQACSVRSCYYPGSRQKYDEFVSHYPEVKLLGAEGSQIVGGQIVHWALAREVGKLCNSQRAHKELLKNSQRTP
jgi:hypothetical protein